MIDLSASIPHRLPVETFGGVFAATHVIRIKLIGTKNTTAIGAKAAIEAFTIHN